MAARDDESPLAADVRLYWRSLVAALARAKGVGFVRLLDDADGATLVTFTRPNVLRRLGGAASMSIVSAVHGVKALNTRDTPLVADQIATLVDAMERAAGRGAVRYVDDNAYGDDRDVDAVVAALTHGTRWVGANLVRYVRLNGYRNAAPRLTRALVAAVLLGKRMNVDDDLLRLLDDDDEKRILARAGLPSAAWIEDMARRIDESGKQGPAAAAPVAIVGDGEVPFPWVATVACRRGEHRIAWRTALHRALVAGDIALSACDLPYMVRIDEDDDDPDVGVSSADGSATILAVGTLLYRLRTPSRRAELAGCAKDDVVLKVSFASRRGSDLGTRLEIEVYRTVINDVVERRHSPHVIVYLGAFECRGFLTRMRRIAAAGGAGKESARRANVAQLLVDEMDALASDDRRRDRDFEQARVLVLERGVGMTMRDWIDLDRASAAQWRALLWQVLYTLEVFNRLGLRHNDLHLRNVWVETDLAADAAATVYLTDEFLADGTYYVVPPSGVMAKLFDFDNAFLAGASLQQPGMDPGGAWCDDAGICNVANAKYAAAVFLLHLFESRIPATVDRALRTWMASTVLEEHWENARPCRRRPVTGGRVDVVGGRYERNDDGTPVCDGDMQWSDDDMLPVADMLRTSYFARHYRRRLPSFDVRFAADATLMADNVFRLPGVPVDALQRALGARRGKLVDEPFMVL